MARRAFPMKNPLIYVAKYTPNINRLEPRNAGVIVWAPDGIAAKFLGEQADGRIVAPGIVPKENRHEYREWITYWRLLLAKPLLRGDDGRDALKSSPDFMRVLQSKSKASFMLCEAGYIKDRVAASELPDIVDEYFEAMVKESMPEHLREHRRALRKATNEALKLVTDGAEEVGSLRNRVPVPCRIGKVNKPLVFDHALLTDDVPRAVFQRVMIPEDSSICAASFMFDKVRHKRGHSAPVKCALVLSEHAELPMDTSDNMRILSQYAQVVDVADPERAAREIQHLIAA